MERLFTIGVYGFDEDSFFSALQAHHIDLFLDLRRRRGVRGAQYAFANSTRLQKRLETLGIAYRHLLGLAPENKTRQLQQQEDVANRVARRERALLSESFVAEYTYRTLDPFDWESLQSDLTGFLRPVLFCVERAPEACHRHLVAARLAGAHGVEETHLMP